jgi:FkbM family methyltransferase
MSNKFFVEIGSNSFETLEPLSFQGWKGLIIEPVPEYFGNLNELEGIIYENVAIGTESGMRIFNYIPEEIIEKNNLPKWARGIGCFGIHPLVQAKHWEKFLTRILVPVMTMKEVLAKHKIEKIDYLKIDTEGYDCKILLSMNLTSIPEIQFEHKHCSATEVLEVLKNLIGYTFTIEGDNIKAVKKI